MNSQLANSRVGDSEEAIQLLKSAFADGVTHIIVTPLHENDDLTSNRLVIEHRVEKLNAALKRQDISITVLEGMEIRMYEKLVHDIKGRVLPLAGSNKYVFIGFQNQRIPLIASDIFFQMQLKGYTPIIANVEWYPELCNNPLKIRDFVHKGVLIHVGAATILGLNGRKKRKIALKLCRYGLVHFVSSASNSRKIGQSLLKPAYSYLEKKITKDAVEQFKRNAASIITGRDFLSVPSVKRGR